MDRIRIVETADGSNTLYSEEYKAHYHSLNGALQESRHIFIENGFKYFSKDELSILEVGFGTGLNAALTSSIAILNKIKTCYTGIERHPLSHEILENINYKSVLSELEYNNLKTINYLDWGVNKKVSDFYTILKLNDDICTTAINASYDLIYYDAFAPEDQPEIWSKQIFEKLYKATKPNGILITYCSKGIVKQALRDSGYKVERLPGPAGKRHILRAIKHHPIEL